MATEPTRNPVKRVAVLVELEDGSTMAIYAQPEPAHNDAEVVVNTERKVQRFDWAKPGDNAGRTVSEELWADVHVKGLHQLVYLMDMPAMIGHVLDAIRNAATP